MKTKPLGHKNYGSIAHLPKSRMGPGDHKCDEGQERIACQKARDKHDRIIVQEKLDGSNVGVARLDDILYPLTRAGYVANTSPYKMHHIFHNWVFENMERTREIFAMAKRLNDDFGFVNISMGMSGDWKIAIEEGATHLRIGSLLFRN